VIGDDVFVRGYGLYNLNSYTATIGELYGSDFSNKSYIALAIIRNNSRILMTAQQV
jgi:hypothetical protein